MYILENRENGIEIRKKILDKDDSFFYNLRKSKRRSLIIRSKFIVISYH
jgi:hypothetical protein